MRLPHLPPITEAEFTKQVLDFAALHCWRTFHVRPGRTVRGWRTPVQGMGKGFPDIVAVRGRLIVAELKVKTKLSPEQEEWLRAFRVAGIEAYAWTPNDWPDIERILT